MVFLDGHVKRISNDVDPVTYAFIVSSSDSGRVLNPLGGPDLDPGRH